MGLLSGVLVLWPQAVIVRCISIRSRSAPSSLSAERAIGQRRVWYELVPFGGLLEETCVRSRAETRASIAQNLEGWNEGARDRVMTGLHLRLP